MIFFCYSWQVLNPRKDPFHECFQFIKHLLNAYYVQVTMLIARGTKRRENYFHPTSLPHSSAGDTHRQLIIKNVIHSIRKIGL